MNIPIVKTLEANVAVRYDHYSDFGSTTNPKVSLRWQPTRTVLVRGSYGTGFLAPTLYQLYTPNIGGVSRDRPHRPAALPGHERHRTSDCNTQFGVMFGGNPTLKPEKSEQATFGVVFEPIPNASFSVDYFKINLKNAITNGISPATILAIRPVRRPRHARPRRSAVPDPAGPDHADRPDVHQPRHRAHPGYRRRSSTTAHPRKAGAACRSTCRARTTSRYDAQNPDGSYTGPGRHSLRGRGHRHHPALEALRIG